MNTKLRSLDSLRAHNALANVVEMYAAMLEDAARIQQLLTQENARLREEIEQLKARPTEVL